MSIKSPFAWDGSRLAWLTLASFDGFGSRTLHRLSNVFHEDGVASLNVGADVLRSFGCQEKTIARFEAYRKRTDGTALAEELERNGISFVLFGDETYPSLLRQISDPPFALFIRGNRNLHDFDSIAVVGTRSNTAYGKHVAEWIATELVRAGFTVVSGLAGGIDAHAHEAALAAKGRCVAVLGSGIDHASIYPRANLGLAERILASGGTLMSEFPPRTEGLKFHFPLRNRIISGLCRATVVVEAADKSGSLITAFQALEQNRDVFAVPGPVTNRQSHGTNRLLTMGAIPCTAPEDIIRHVRGEAADVPAQPILTADETALLKLLDSPLHTDEIARRLGVPVSAANARLTALEMNGWVEPQRAGVYARSPYWKSAD